MTDIIFNLGKYLVEKWFLRDVTIITKGAIPLHDPAIIVANHNNPWDPPLIILSARKRIVHFFTAKCLFKGFTGIFLRCIKQIPVQSGLTQLNKKAFKKASKYLEDGGLVGIFPYPFDLTKKKRVLYTGIIKLIIKNDVPVIPVRVVLDNEKHWKSFFDITFKNAIIKIGDPIAGFRDICIKADKKNYETLTKILLKRVDAL